MSYLEPFTCPLTVSSFRLREEGICSEDTPASLGPRLSSCSCVVKYFGRKEGFSWHTSIPGHSCFLCVHPCPLTFGKSLYVLQWASPFCVSQMQPLKVPLTLTLGRADLAPFFRLLEFWPPAPIKPAKLFACQKPPDRRSRDLSWSHVSLHLRHRGFVRVTERPDACQIFLKPDIRTL